MSTRSDRNPDARGGSRTQAPPEPVAVIGAGCRFAGGGDSPAAFWDLLISGRDGIGPMPQDRWGAYRGLGPEHASAVRRADLPAGFLPDVEGFDAAFFGLTPREAELMDPQQRILLEVVWEALEHAGLPPAGLAGSDTGVFIGVGSDDYGRRLLEDLPGIEAWTGIGSAMCAAANRISYAMDLHGPSLAVDTACSASLVATHLACQSLRAGESSVALVGGINLIVSPGLSVTLEAAGATSPDGRSKPFDASADGYGRGEGGAVLVLKRLSDAERDGDRVLAVIRGSGVQQDGRTNGIMAPSGTAQQQLLEETCLRTGIDPSSVDYIEAHGTGTPVGDPLEAGALSAVYGQGRPADDPCLLGSVKPNIGHLEAGAGVAGLLKATLALHHGEIPPSLNFREGNPAIDWDGNGLRVVTEPTPWPERERPRRAGVSGFGYGGTIAHVLLEQAPGPVAPESVGADAAAARQDSPARLFPLSGKSRAALREYAGDLADWLTGAGRDVPLASVGHTLALRRSHLDVRAGVVARDRDDLVAKLRVVAAAEESREAPTGTVSEPEGTVWVFSGHGSQWAGMGRELLESEPAFAAAIDEIEPVFLEEIGFSPRQVLTDAAFESVDRVQTMIFAMQIGLAAVWRSHGAAPTAVIGHSVGEIAAAVTAGALSLPDGARLICRRSLLLRRAAGQGAMFMASLSLEEASERLAGRSDVVAAIQASPESTVVSGDRDAVNALFDAWRAEGVDVRKVASDVAFHSPHMDPLLAELSAAADGLARRDPDIPMYSTALEDPRTTPAADGAYWAANLRSPVRLAAAVRAAAEDGHRSFIEVSAHPVVAHSIGETLADLGIEDAFVGSTLRRDRPESLSLLVALGAAHCHGTDVDWARLQPAGDLVTLPQVAWQRTAHWRETTLQGSGQGHQHDVHAHGLLGAPVPVAGRSMRLWRTELEDGNRPYPGSHTINGTEIVPAAVLINTFLGVLGADDETVRALDEVALRLPLTVAERRELQVVRDGSALHIASRTAEGDGAWLTHTTATTVAGDDAGALPERLPRPSADAAPADPGDILRHLASVGVPSMGFAWTIDDLMRAEGSLRARVRTEQPEHSPATWAPLFDAALSIAPSAYPGPAALRMVAHVGRVRTVGAVPDAVDIHVAHNAAQDTVDVLVADEAGRVVAALTAVRYSSLGQDTALTAQPHELVHELVWRPLEPASADGTPAAYRDVVVVGDGGALAPALAERLTAHGARVRSVDDPAELDGLDGLDKSVDVLVLPGTAEGAPPRAAAAHAWLLLRTAQCLAGLGTARFPRLWCVTGGVRESRDEAQLAHASLWGLARVIAGEHAELWGGIVDLETADSAGPADADALLEILRSAPAEDVIAVRGGKAETARLVRTQREAAYAPVRCRPDGTYLITGGLGVLGLEVAHWLAEQGARRLVLAGRGALPPRADWHTVTDEDVLRRIEGVRSLESQGVTVRTVSLDIADAEAVARQLTPDALGLPAIRGIVHAAGVLDNRMAGDVDEESLRQVMRPKVDGAWALHGQFPPGSVDFLVFFSSCGQLLGLPGQASYGSANSFLDALAIHRNAASAAADTISFAWTSWRGQGMAVNEVVDLELRERGVSDISVSEAFGAWEFAARRGAGCYPVLRNVPVEQGTPRLPVLREIAVEEAADAPGSQQNGVSFAGLPPEQLRERAREEVAAQVAAEMKLPTASLDIRRSLVEQGLDSVMTIVVRRRLEKRFGLKLPATLLWHQPTVTAIADHVAELLTSSDD
ncbi:type I polyketide synthase [[Kitasatospora] papulosa]|uniref:type I polyketide synthase n=1 Tax=Streptomyces TaxID=1883 RepID=UPI0018FE82E8|nr:type I polyketide synthase [Streptomyces sp. NRRL B-24051]